MTIGWYAALLVVGVILLLVTGVRLVAGGLEGTSRPTARGPIGAAGSARQILEERYAAGELGTEEYRHRLRVLEGGDR